MQNDSTKGSPLLLSYQETSRLLGISVRKLSDLRKDREIPYVRVGRCVRFPLDALKRWIEDHKQGGQVNEQAPSQETGKDIQQGGLTP